MSSGLYVPMVTQNWTLMCLYHTHATHVYGKRYQKMKIQDIVQKEEYKLCGQKNLYVEYMKYLQSLKVIKLINGKWEKTKRQYLTSRHGGTCLYYQH